MRVLKDLNIWLVTAIVLSVKAPTDHPVLMI